MHPRSAQSRCLVHGASEASVNDAAHRRGITPTEPAKLLGEGMGRQVRIPHRHLHRLVPENFLKLEKVATLHHPMAREGMTKVVKADVPAAFATALNSRKPSVPQDTVKDLLEDPCRATLHRPCLTRKDQATAGHQAVRSKDGQQRVKNGHVSNVPPFRGSGIATLHGNQSLLEVHVPPLESRQLASPHAGVGGGSVENEGALVFIVSGGKKAA